MAIVIRWCVGSRDQLMGVIKGSFFGQLIEEDGFSYYIVNDPQRLLEWATVNGYVFHGSTRKIKGDLIPHQANDLTKESGNRKAVYMTRHPLLAEFTALTGGKNVGRRKNSCYLDITEDHQVRYPGTQEFGVETINEIGDSGYVYFFDKKEQVDEEIGGECLSYKPVKPLVVIKIDRNYFRYPINKL